MFLIKRLRHQPNLSVFVVAVKLFTKCHSREQEHTLIVKWLVSNLLLANMDYNSMFSNLLDKLAMPSLCEANSVAAVNSPVVADVA